MGKLGTPPRRVTGKLGTPPRKACGNRGLPRTAMGKPEIVGGTHTKMILCFASCLTGHTNLARTYVFFPWDCREMHPPAPSATKEATHLGHKREVCPARFSRAGVPSGPAAGESNRYQVLHTLLPSSFPGMQSAPEATQKTHSALHCIYFYFACVTETQTQKPFRMDGRGQGAGGAKGRKSSAPTGGLGSSPTDAFTHQGLVKASKV